MKKIIFFGFGKLGKECMRELMERGHHIEFVMTHKENQKDSVDTFSQENGLEYSYRDARKNTLEMSEKIKSMKPDLLISVNYRYIIPKEILMLVNYAMNVHGSLLPKYRGRTPHVWSIIHGETESGITCHLIEETVDTGDIIAQVVIPIEKDDTGYTLLKKFEVHYPQIVMDSIDKLEKGFPLMKQDEEAASYYGKRIPDMGYIDFRKTASEVINFVRAQAEPYPGAYYYLCNGAKIIINRIVTSKSYEWNMPIGVIKQFGQEYYVRCHDHVLRIEDYRIID